MKRILVAGMVHESNSFNPIITGAKDMIILRGEEILNNIRKHEPVSGVVTGLRAAGYEPVPIISASAVPNGEVDYEVYKGILDEIIETAKAENEKKPFDGITLALHGSMRVKDFGEAEGPLLEALRKEFPNIPLFSSLDTHTTMTEKMHKNCDGFVGYKCAPHTDRFETGEHAARMTQHVLETGIKPYSAWVKVPILIAGEQSSTTVEPMISLAEELRETEKKPGIMACSYLMGFPWADNADSSCAVYVVAESQEQANEEAVRLAELMWSRKDEFCFQTEAYHEEEALNVAFQSIADGVWPVFLSDSGDNPTAGSSSDCTELLKFLMEDERTWELPMPVAYGGIYDPEACAQCEGKVGQEITLTFGAKFDTKTTAPITATGKVVKFVKGWGAWGAFKSDIAVFRTHNVDVIIAEKHIGYAGTKVYFDMDLNPAERQIVVCKLGYLGDDHEQYSKRGILVLTKGSTNEDLATLNYEKVPRPIFPLEKEFAYDARANLK